MPANVPIELVFLFGFGFFSGIYLFHKGLRCLRFKRLVENTPTSKIRSIAMGLVEVYGEAAADERKRDYSRLQADKADESSDLPAYFRSGPAMPAPDPDSDIVQRLVSGSIKTHVGLLKSPLTKKDCVYYRFKIEEERGSGKHRHWETMVKDEVRLPFYLKDDTGMVLIDPNDAYIEIPLDFEYESGMWRGDPPPCVMDYLESAKIRDEGLFGFNKHMRFTEAYIEPKDKLYVLGTAAENPFTAGMNASEHTERIIIRKGKENMFYISDKPEGMLLHNLGGGVLNVYGGAAMSLISLALLLFYFRIL